MDDFGPGSQFALWKSSLKAKGVNLQVPCRECGATQWQLGNHTTLFHKVGTEGRVQGTPGRPEGFEVVHLWCGHCGFLRSFAVAPLVKEP